jgi:flavin reductase (DIM6/NTAB) family NADH-FMN oxidoreductase RutF
MKYSKEDIQKLDKRFRANFVNSLSGFKSLNLVGTTDGETYNLSIFNSVFHLGADPALLGMISRPNSVKRDTIEIIRRTGFYTLNAVCEEIYMKAHHTSARIEGSEFNHCSLKHEIKKNFTAPFVEESSLKIAMKFIREIPIIENNTIMIIGEIQEVYFDEVAIDKSGYLHLEKLNILTGVSLEGYYKPELLSRLKYAKADKEIEKI